MNTDMTDDPDAIRAQVAELLGEHAEVGEADLDAVAARLEEAHELLLQALESVEKG
ncbi:Uncharacterised protein [Mycolicibacterium vanbaalenii]|uniref:Uncharacterized protein n=1 Tax=Mycolicibacterium vanbaalenii TaxID=110539 RepID=A0A5S9QQN7_MYCVN|nr:hypothetical protein [Mycolicibacterium vanbaalenii]CAA0121094.1 Uncharacterised protein [Mycolicibacterium vanbaalenii]